MELPSLRKKSKVTFDPKFVRDRYETAIKAVRAEAQEYWLNHAFVRGHQWLYFNAQTRRLDQVPSDPDRVQVTINRMWPASRIAVAKLMQRQMTFEVMPEQADDATIRASRLSEAVVSAISYDHGWEVKRETNYWQTWKGGTAGICVDWDPRAGETASLADTSAGETDPVMTGDTVETTLSIAEMAVQPGVHDAERALWWIKAQAMTPEDAQATYDLPVRPPADASIGLTPFQKKLLTSHVGQGEEPIDMTLVLTYYERPNRQTPQGRVAVVIGNEFVDGGEKPWPFPWKDRLNLVITRETPIENRWAGETVLSAARPVQVAYNASWSSIIEHMKLAGNARLMVPNSALDIIDQLTDLPGELLPYADGLEKPSYVSPPQMPQWWIEQPVRLGKEMDDILNVHDVSRGTAPVNIESGYGLSVLAEQDSTPVTRLAKEAAQAWGRVASLCLKLYQANVKETRKASVRAPGQGGELVTWTGQDLMGQTTATVPLDAVMPRSRAAMQALAEKLLTMGQITSFSQFARIAELPGQRDMIEAVNPAVAKARRENHLLKAGRAIVPEPFDVHASHIEEHNVFRMSVRWDEMSDTDKELVNQHVQAHEVLAAEAMGRQVSKVAVDPALAAVPDADGAPSLSPDQLPPESLPQPAGPATPPAGPDMGTPTIPAGPPVDAPPPMP